MFRTLIAAALVASAVSPALADSSYVEQTYCGRWGKTAYFCESRSATRTPQPPKPDPYRGFEQSPNPNPYREFAR